MSKEIEEIKAMKELSDLIEPREIQYLVSALDLPRRVIEENQEDSLDFLIALKSCEEFDRSKFLTVIEHMGDEGLLEACQYWISFETKQQGASDSDAPKSLNSFVKLLRNNVTVREWKFITRQAFEKYDLETVLPVCLEKGIITRDLDTLCDAMRTVNRSDLVNKIMSYWPAFQMLSAIEFEDQLMSCVEEVVEQKHDEWIPRLKKYILSKHKSVSVVLGEAKVPLESVYTPLTIVEHNPEELGTCQETTLNEIDFLRKMTGENLNKLKLVDLEKLISETDPYIPEIWSIIGNAGSGKTFLSKHIAFMYANDELSNFPYVLWIECRNEQWHELEVERQDDEKQVGRQFIQHWLCLCMARCVKWTEFVTKYLMRSHGEDLLLILDGVDEFTKKVPFKSSLLYLLLCRRILHKCSILVTSRPAAWSQLSADFGSNFQIELCFQVLGFSPSNRNEYFRKRISDELKLADCYTLFARHDEINQLSLVPVNASLFSSLFNQSSDILSQTLSHLYSHLIVYMIKRQLHRIWLPGYAKARHLSDFHPGILTCLSAISLEAHQGVYERNLSLSGSDIMLYLDNDIYPSERLGLMHCQVRSVKGGGRVKVWSFAHLTLQEFMSAYYLSDQTQSQQCAITHYIGSSSSVFSMYQMVVRFLCGLLSGCAGLVIGILSRKIIPVTQPIHELPLFHQLGYDFDFIRQFAWIDFTKAYLQMCTSIVESSSELVPLYFNQFRHLVPAILMFSFSNFTPSPYEWHCFIQTLQFVEEVQVVYISTAGFITETQFSNLLNGCPHSCFIHYLALFFSDAEYMKVLSYTRHLHSLPPRTKLSIELSSCDLTEVPDSQFLFPCNNRIIGSLSLNQSRFSDRSLSLLTNKFSSLEVLLYQPAPNTSNWSALEKVVISNTKLIGVHIVLGHNKPDPKILSHLSSIEELSWWTSNPFPILIYLNHFSNLSFLQIMSSVSEPPIRPSYGAKLTKLIRTNSKSLRVLEFSFLQSIGFQSCSSLLSSVQTCSNLVSLVLQFSPFVPTDISSLHICVTCLRSLVKLFLVYIPLKDSGVTALCSALILHPSVAILWITKCELSSSSCETFKQLIPTMPLLEKLTVKRPELSQPDPNPLLLLSQTAEQYSVLSIARSLIDQGWTSRFSSVTP